MTLRLPALDPAKRIASLFLLPDCDMACAFCASEPEFDVMTRGDAEAVLQALPATSIESVVLGGGEPLLWPHGLADLAAAARELGFLVQVCTNGAAPIGPEDLPAAHRIILPLESTDAEVHDRLRQRAGGHHAGVVTRIESLLTAGRELTISTVVTSENLQDLPHIATYLGGLAAAGGALHAWHLYRFLPVGRGGAPNSARLAVSPQEYLAACRTAKACGLPFPVYRRDDMLRSSTVEFLWMEDGRLRVGSGVVAQQSR